ncbi:17289_t:CDS:1, partial [Cetraspora pellucida]
MPELPKLPEIFKILTAKLISVDEEKDLQVYQIEDVKSDSENKDKGEDE